MGSTFVGIANNGFGMHDGFLELWLRFAALHIDDTEDDHSLVYSIRNEWLLASRAYFNGFVAFGLEEHIATVEGKAIILHVFESLLSALKKGPKLLNAGVINLMGVSG